MAFLRTVLGDVPTAQVGHIQPHEHLLSDIGATTRRQGTALQNHDPITLENLYEIRRHHSPVDAKMTDVGEAIHELGLYREAGGSAIVDASSVGLGRNPAGLVAVSQATGVHVVMGSGYYVADYHPPELADRSRDNIAQEIITDISDGVGETEVRAGLIGEIGLTWPVDPVEATVLVAAVDAQLATGAALMIHPGRDSAAPLDAMARVLAAGADPTRVVMSHIDRTLFTADDMSRLADTGCYLEFDLFGQESSYYPYAPIDMPNDATRIDHLQRLADAGFAGRLLVSQDICFQTHRQRYGGEGYGHLLRNVVPLMRRKGMSDNLITALTITNPLTALGLET